MRQESISRKILLFTASGATFGGVETWLSEFVPALPEAGYEAVVALTRGMQTNDSRRYRELHPELPYVEVDAAGLPRPSRILACLRTIQRVRPDIVVPLGVVDAVPACGLAKKSDKKMRVIARTQGLLPAMLADLEDLESVFDFAVCDGKLNAGYLEEVIGFPSTRIRHVPNGAKQPSAAHRQRKPGAPIRIVYVGRLTPRDKRCMDLLALVHELDTLKLAYQLTVVGDGPMRDKLEAGLSNHDCVTFSGSLPHEDVYRDIYPDADVLVSFSSSESFGISIVEAMINHVVPVSSRFLGWKSVGTIEDGKNALTFDIGDLKEAARSISKLAASPDLLAQLSNNGAAKAEKEFSWRRCISSWVDILGEVRELPQRESKINYSSLLRSDSGRLEKLKVPPVLVDRLRRLRASIAPIALPGGEEWPLFYRHHSQRRLDSIAATCGALDEKI